MKLADSLILFGSLGFLLIWVKKYLYEKDSFGDSYFFLMMAVAGFLWYVYRRGTAKMKKDSEESEKPTIKQSSKKRK